MTQDAEFHRCVVGCDECPVAWGLEQASDVVVLIHRPEYYGIKHDEEGNDTKGMANIIFAKGRNIGVGEIPLKFISK